MLEALSRRAVSSRFPHRVAALLNGYLIENSPLAAKSIQPVPAFPVAAIVVTEVEHALDRQGEDKASEAFKTLARLLIASPNNAAASRLTEYLRHLDQLLAPAHARQLAARLASHSDHALTPCLEKLVHLLQKLGQSRLFQVQDFEAALASIEVQSRQDSGLPEKLRDWLTAELERARGSWTRDRVNVAIRAVIGLCQAVSFVQPNLAFEEPARARSAAAPANSHLTQP
jgi:hypothetical protein